MIKTIYNFPQEQEIRQGFDKNFIEFKQQKVHSGYITDGFEEIYLRLCKNKFVQAESLVNKAQIDPNNLLACNIIISAINSNNSHSVSTLVINRLYFRNKKDFLYFKTMYPSFNLNLEI